MPRRARIMLSGIPVHITHRGNNRQDCFFEEQDRSFYLLHLSRHLPRAQCSLHAYCLMTSHVHLLVTPASLNSCARLMKAVAQLYTQYVNRTYGRSGTLWEGRFHSCLVQSEEYLLTCYRYVEENPMRAGLVRHPSGYRWSSYEANAQGARSSLLTRHEEYLRLGRRDEERQQAYRTLFAVQLDPKRIDEIRAATYGNFALGSPNFVKKVSAALGRRAERGTPGRPSRQSEQEAGQLDLLTAPKKNVVCP
jgi:putative transposase